jgi:acetyl esterase/lipase
MVPAMPTRRAAPFAVLLALVVLLATAGVTRLGTGGGDGGTDVDDEFETATLTVQDPPLVGDPGVPEGRCGVVVYTPRGATDRHRADLCRPAGTPRGLVILIHGGGGYSGDRSQMRGWAGWYRSEGFATLSIDYTLVGDGSPEPVYPRPEQDVKAAIQWGNLQAEALGYEEGQILLHGSSAGARLAAEAFVSSGDRAFWGPDLWGRDTGVSDAAAGLIGFYGYYDGDTLEAERYYGGLQGEGNRFVDAHWAAADSVARAADATGPVLLFHGDVDGLINIAQTERFGSALAEAGVDVTAHIVTDGDHAFDGRYGDLTTATGEDAADAIDAWLATRFPI